MPREIVLEENGFRFRRFLQKECSVSYADVLSYSFYGRGTLSIIVNTHDGKYSFYIDVRRFKFLLDELKIKVGEDKELERKFW